MHRNIPGVLLAAALILGAAPAHSVEFFPLEEVRPGLEAHMVTVLRGFQADTLALEILDVYAGSTPESHIVLARGRGELERTGIAQGMSGSPVYVGDRLLGALAFAFVDAREPIGGITPAAQMRSVLQPYFDSARTEKMSSPLLLGKSGGGAMPAFPEWMEMCRSGEWMQHLQPEPSRTPGQWGTPIALPVMWSGPEAVYADFAAGFAACGLHLISAGSGFGWPSAAASGSGDWSGWPSDLGPGDAIALNMLWGDATAAAIGTVTWTEGRQLYALGHPFLQTGFMAVPVSRAKIHAVIPSRRVSFKMGTAGPALGSLVADTAPGVAARLEEVAPNVSLKLTIRNAGLSRDPKTFEFFTARHPFLTPSLLAMAVASTLTFQEYALGLSTLESHIRVLLPGGRVIEREDRFRTLSPAQTVASEILAPVSYLVTNTFRPFALEGVELELDLHDELLALEVDRIRLLRDRVRPGETLELDVHLRRHQGDELVRRVAIEVPADLAAQEVAVMVGSANAFFEWERDQVPEKYRPRDFEHLLSLIEEFPPNNRLFVRLYGASRGLVMRGREVSSLPLSKWQAMRHSLSAGDLARLDHRLLAEQILKTEEVIVGGVATTVAIEPSGRR